MNNGIRERQKRKIRRLIEQSAAVYPLTSQHGRAETDQTPPQATNRGSMPIAADSPVIVPLDASLPPVEAIQHFADASVRSGRPPKRSDPARAPIERDPEKLWKSNSAPWLGWNVDGSAPNSRNTARLVDRREGGSSFWRHFRLQLIVSAVLFGAIWGLFRLSGGMAEQGQAVVTNALTSEFDFQTVLAWYDRTFAGSPAFIPLFGSGGDAQTVDGSVQISQLVVSPLPNSTLVQSFAQSLGGIELAGKPGESVAAAETGRVVLVTPDTGKGQTIVIQHAGSRTTQYGLLGTATVNKDDWVEAGDIIGRLASNTEEDSSLLYFAVKEAGRFVDPSEVIPLD